MSDEGEETRNGDKAWRFGPIELWLAAVNGLTSIWLFGFDQAGEFYNTYRTVVTGLMPALDRSLYEISFAILLSPVLLPFSVIVLVPLIALGVDRTPVTMTMLYGSLVVNAFLWGELVAYLIRLIRTGSHATAKSYVFTWWRRASRRSPG